MLRGRQRATRRQRIPANDHVGWHETAVEIGEKCPKITASHLGRWAIVYVRQSHPQQVQRHPESAQVQADLQERAVAWGWPRERIRILDGDQGCSATTTVGRDDFAWLL